MGLWSFFCDAVDWVKDKVESAIDWVTDKLSITTYDESNVEDHVDVDAVLAEFREEIEDDVNATETRCMKTISIVFSDLIDKTKDMFPDLVEIIENEQEKAENDLKGTVMNYVREHLSKNDTQFLEVLKMKPGKAKAEELEAATDRVLGESERFFNLKLKKCTEHLLGEFDGRLNNRIVDQEKQMNQRINELEKLQDEAEKGQLNVEKLKERCAPVMESAECMIHILKNS